MTNREKYIDNASNEDVAQSITNFVMSVTYGKGKDKNKSISECIAEWLSQEVEVARTCKDCLYGKTFEDDVKRYCCYNYLKAVAGNEGCSKWKSKNTGKDILESMGLNKNVYDKTADEMLEELGYKDITDDSDSIITYQRESDDIDYEFEMIYMHSTGKYFYKEKVKGDKSYGTGIDEEEDKAIHKKIEELENGNSYQN